MANDLTRRRIIAGLGNPGKQFAFNRHNIGFLALDRFAAKHGLRFDKMLSRGLVAAGDITLSNGAAGVAKVALVKPQTMMNDSGACIGPVMRFYKSEPLDVLAVYDELDLPAGQVRLRKSGGAGGHNGVKSLIQHVGTQEFPRVRIGIGRPPGRMAPKDYVLQDFSAGEFIELEFAIDRVINGIERWLFDTIDNAMNFVNAGAGTRE